MKFKLYYCYRLCLTIGPERLQQLPVQRIRWIHFWEDSWSHSWRGCPKKEFWGISSESLYVMRGKRNIRDSGSKNKGRSQSKTRDCSSVTCWNCKEVGHFRNQCPNDKQVSIAEDSVNEDLLVCCAERSVDSWVMDSKALLNLVIEDFGKVRLADNKTLDVTRAWVT